METAECSVMGEVKMTYVTKGKISEQPQIHSSLDAVRFFRSIWEPDSINYRETMYLLCLNRMSRVLAWYKLSAGGVSGTVCDPKIVFQCCLLSNASSFIAAHNHPSQSTTPSQMDINLTKQLKQAGEVMDIKMADSMILTEDRYFSFQDEGIF